MSDDEGEQFESADAGASTTYPMQAGELRKGSHIMIKGFPCKVCEISMSKTGKHGHAKAHIVALDIFTSKKYEDLCPASHNVSVPFVTRQEYQVLTADPDSGEVSLLKEDGTTKDDLNLPTFVKIGEPTPDDKDVAKQIVEESEKGEKTVIAMVQAACGMEKIIGVKLT
eukprot:TRINITY_DN80381_c0_g1_i1.p1 TRINITY_DN80381_c0_g1~~TRINITY_DN80381_c0_g1_i1.p1  ORF type:complete len:192 (-),score=49.27 TRINITY_DN80381_c0_g1_i1:176-682(-)